MKTNWFLIGGIIFSIGCARVMVETPREPIKVDISMRLDIYQHIEKDIDAIEDIVSGSPEETQSSNKKDFLDYFIPQAYAQEGLSPEVEQAALRRRDRHAELISWQKKGIIGEDRLGLLDIRNPQVMDSALLDLVKAENNDRMIIYAQVAEKNNAPVREVQKIYAKRLQDDAPAGTEIEVLNQETGAYEWKRK
ncbi:MAG: DUF1318 domain-containing protein [Candidatus Omnitrophota bacterium]|jgi:uncharacterized protein YdbL (DUF1318 family)